MKKLTLIAVAWFCAINSASGLPDLKLIEAQEELSLIDYGIEMSYILRREEVPINDVTCERKRELARLVKLLLDDSARDCLTQSENETALVACKSANLYLGVLGSKRMIKTLTACSERTGLFSDERADFDALMESLPLIHKSVRLREAQLKHKR